MKNATTPAEFDDDTRLLRATLIELLHAERGALARAWVAELPVGLVTGTRSAALVQAERFLALLAEGLRSPAHAPPTMQVVHDAVLAREFPAIYGISCLLVLARLVVGRLQRPGGPPLSLHAFFVLVQEGLASIPISHTAEQLLNEPLSGLSRLSVELTRLRDQDAITALALAQAPALVGAAGSAIWLWDADQHAPVMMITEGERVMPVSLPTSLLQYLRLTCESCAWFSVDAGESDATWPALLRHRAVAFIPLPAQHGCLGILTVQHQQGAAFSHDDILLLSSLGNLVATALQNAQLHHSERILVNLLQTSISRLIQATSSPVVQHEEFIQSLLHVTEGLTRADAVCARIDLEGQQGIITSVSGMREDIVSDDLSTLAGLLHAHIVGDPHVASGLLGELLADFPTHPLYLKQYYVVAPIVLDGRTSGIIFALSPNSFTEEQMAFLPTMAGLIGVGIGNMQQSARNQHLLLQLNNILDYIPSIIMHDQDGEDHADGSVTQRILRITVEKITRSLNTPIGICGWVEGDGGLRIWPDTTIGLPKPLAQALGRNDADPEQMLPLTIHNRVIADALRQGVPLTRRQGGRQFLAAFPWLKALGVEDWICVPMGGKGIILLADTRPREFPFREQAIASTYANMVALAMENSRLDDRLRYQLHQVERLHHFSTSVSATMNIHDILHRLMRGVTDLLQAPAVLVTLADADSLVQQVEGSFGLTGKRLQGRRFSADGIISTVAREQSAISSSDLPGDGRDHVLRELAREERLTSSLTVPIVARQRALGTLTVFSSSLREFTAAEQQLVEMMASDTAIAIQNAQILQLEKERTHELHAQVGHIARQVVETTELAFALLEIARRERSSTTGLARASLRLECLRTVQAVLSDDLPPLANVRDAMQRLFAERAHQQADTASVKIRVEGAALSLPWREATLLGLLIHEGVMARTAGIAPPEGGQIRVDLQQAGRDMLAQIDDNLELSEKARMLPAAIVALVEHTLPGKLSYESLAGIRRLRFRFYYPPDSAG